MIYKKGTFTVIPNVKHLKGKPTEYLSVFFWLCFYADDSGSCYPTRKQLARDCGLTDRTIDKYVSLLESDGLIIKKKRKKKGTKEYTSNLYKILLPTKVAKIETVENNVSEPNETSVSTPSERNIPKTIPNTNYTHLTIKQQVANFSFKRELDKLKNSKWKPDKIFALYLVKKGFVFDSKEKLDLEKKINLKALIKLSVYNGKEIDKTMRYCQDKFYDVTWNCHTVVKVIGQVINKK